MADAAVGVTYELTMGFLPESVAIADPERPGLLRAGSRAGAPYGGEWVEARQFRATDLVQDSTYVADLCDGGFDTVDLSAFEDLQRACRKARAAGQIDAEAAATIRASLDGAVLATAGGRRLKILHVAGEGFIMRSAGPNRLSVVGPTTAGMNDHGPATSVHADQDVFGTPVRQLMDGRAPSLLFHDSPDGFNHDARLMLANLWIPLRQITQPLVFADGRSLDRPRQQLRYGLATDSFLERDDDQRINDIWTFLHDPRQEWYFRSEMDHATAYVFNTTSTAHGSGALIGEDEAEECYLLLARAEGAIEGGDVTELRRILDCEDRPRPHTTPALGRAIDLMAELIESARRNPDHARGVGAAAWLASSRKARYGVVRNSLELRLVVSIDD